MKKLIEEKLRKNFQPSFLEVKNNSAQHRGHLGDDGGGETHFAIVIESLELQEMNKIAAHRAINKILKEEFALGLHALEIRVVTKVG